MKHTRPSSSRSEFLPVSRDDMVRRGWDRVDFALVTGDAYVDHPSFGAALISRLLESRGYRVGIIAQPDWKSPEPFKALGRPRLGFLITAGNIDSMVARYTAAKKPRSEDSYSPGGKAGLRPERASIVYAVRAREAYKNVPIILGGLEASLRRLSHYDYWQDKVRRSVLLDAKADLLLYGMAERALLETAERLAAGVPVAGITDVRGTVRPGAPGEDPASIPDAIELPPFETVSEDPRAFAESFAIQYRNTDPFTAKPLVERAEGRFTVQNPPAYPLPAEELDAVYGLPYARTWHPMYDEAGGVPGIEEVKWSLTSSRGCFGGCSFCSLTFHQGRIVQARSADSIVNEAKSLIADPEFKGYIHDVGGPTANFRRPACEKQLTRGACRDRQCLFPEPCKKLVVDHREYLSLLRELRSLPGVKKVFIRSGIRFDYLTADPDGTFFRELCEHHVSGQLKVAPEHVSPKVLEAMGKPAHRVYRRFTEEYERLNRELGKKQYLVPYLISGHPGSDFSAAIELAEYLNEIRFTPEQVQDFYPTPGTVSTCMYHTGIDPRTMKPIYVPRSPREKAMQRALLQYRKPENHALVIQALTAAGRQDLIGFGLECLVRPEPGPARRVSDGRRTDARPRTNLESRSEHGSPHTGSKGSHRGGKPGSSERRNPGPKSRSKPASGGPKPDRKRNRGR